MLENITVKICDGANVCNVKKYIIENKHQHINAEGDLLAMQISIASIHVYGNETLTI